MVEISSTKVSNQFRLGYAGDTLNTAWYLRHLLGSIVQIDYFTAVGIDAVSNKMIKFIEKAGIGTEYILRIKDKSVGLYMIQLQDGERNFSYWRGDSAARTLAKSASRLQVALDSADIAYFSGITLAILPARDRICLLKVLKGFRQNGGVVIFDPNLRPKLWNSLAQMTETVMRAAAISDIVLPSFEDEAIWFGDLSEEGTVRRYVAAHAGCCVVKNGSGRILAYEDGSCIQCDPIQDVIPVDSTAAGDSFNAGFIAARLQGADLKEAVFAGSFLAAQVILKPGALVNLDFNVPGPKIKTQNSLASRL